MHRSSDVELKRDVGWFGSFAMGYGDVGADIFIALGIVTLYAGGAAPIAFLTAALVYVAVGLAYAELAPTYPYAGGSQVYAMRASNSLAGFLAGWALMLSYILCISLFAVAAAGYLKFLFPILSIMSLEIPQLGVEFPSIGVVGALLVALLIFLNYIGIKYSASFIAFLVFFGLLVQGIILFLGYALAFEPSRMLEQVLIFGSSERLPEVGYLPWLDINTNNFLYGLTLAMASFIGIESIAQAAEETKRPHRWIPRAAKLSVVAVFLSVILFAVLSMGVLEWETLGNAYENPVARLVVAFPLVGAYLAPLVAFAAFILCYASSNTGVIGISRLAASMGRFGLLPRWFYKIHPRYRTPTRTLTVFGIIGLLIALVGDIPFIASIYNFGALLSYMLLMYSLLLLRNRDQDVYRPWKIPFALKFRRGDDVVELPLAGLLGLAGTTILWILVVFLHPFGRLFGFTWIAVGIAFYIISRRLTGKQLLSHEEGEMIAPMAYRMDIGILIRPYDDLDVVRKTITHHLDKRFRVRLISVLDPAAIGNEATRSPAEVQRYREHLEADLAELCRNLREKGYEAAYCVHVGDFDTIVEQELQSGKIDMLAYIKRSTEKATLEKGHEPAIHKIMQKHPGKIMVLKRTGE